MSRLTPEREFQIRNDGVLSVDYLVEVLEELDAVRRERDEAILGAYRAAADKVRDTFCENAMHCCCNIACEEAIESLPPQSALDAVERDRRELVEATILICGVGCVTADDVLAKVGRGR